MSSSGKLFYFILFYFISLVFIFPDDTAKYKFMMETTIGDASRDRLSYKLQESTTYYKSLRSQVDGFGTRLIGLEVEMQ